jgi:SAM-dependent methyltransferase
MIDIHRLPFWPALRLPYRFVRSSLQIAVDKVLGVQTTLLDNELHVGLDRPATFKHGPIGWTTLWRIFRRLGPTPEDVLYEVGCGNGRPLIVARQFPFKRLVGIELSTRMHEQAVANLASCRLGPKSPVELINGDALAQPIPEGTSIVFFSSPFQGELFDRFIAHLLDDLDSHPRRLRFVYYNPREQAKLKASSRFRLDHRFPGLRPSREWSRMLTTHIYEVLPSDAAHPSSADRK